MVRRAFVLVVLVAACGAELGEPPEADDADGKGDGAGGGGSSMTLTPAGFLAQIGMEYCDESFRCKGTYPGGPAAFAQDFGATVQTCYGGVEAYYQPQLVEQSIAAGRVVFTAAAAQACLDGIEYPQSCGTFWEESAEFPQVCGLALVGTLPDGAACVSLFDCANPSSLCDPATKRCVRP